MADNTTLYIIIGIVLLFALMRANAEPSATGAPAMSAYLRRRVNLPEVITTKQQERYSPLKTMPPAYLRGTLSADRIERFQQGVNLKPQYVKVCKGPKCSA